MGRPSKNQNRESKPPVFCNFCGKKSDGVEHIFAGPNNIFICNECIMMCHSIIHGEEKHHTEGLTKKEIKEQKEVCYTTISTMAKLQGWLTNELKALDAAEQKINKEDK